MAQPEDPERAREYRMGSMAALGILSHEPPKMPGGSEERRQWLGLVLDIQTAFHEHGFPDAVNGFLETVNEDRFRLSKEPEDE